MPSSLNLEGRKFGRLTVLCKAANKNGKTAWLCACDCGSFGVFKTMNLRAGDTASCGCIPCKPIQHGHNRKGARSRTYRIWAGMLTRCRNPNHGDYRFYGAKGISVCEKWLVFSGFLADMGEAPEGLTLDRIDATKNYEPGNCRWISHSENSRRASLARHNAKRMTFAKAPLPVEMDDVPA